FLGSGSAAMDLSLDNVGRHGGVRHCSFMQVIFEFGIGEFAERAVRNGPLPEPEKSANHQKIIKNRGQFWRAPRGPGLAWVNAFHDLLLNIRSARVFFRSDKTLLLLHKGCSEGEV